jgi:tetratricopeptide (TPR) repeat protein
LSFVHQPKPRYYVIQEKKDRFGETMFNSKFYYVFSVIVFSPIMLVTVQSQSVFALSAAEVGQIAKGVAVRIGRIDNQASFGSGVIIKQEGNSFTVLTAAHVVPTADKYEVITSDDKRYPVNYSTVKQFSGVDLAILKFTSSQNYSVVKIGDSTKVMAGSPCYVSGFPLKSKAITEVIYNFTQGQVTANASRPLQDGYALVYTNLTLPGMSGGPVLNDQGLLIGIHGRADTTESPQNPELNSNIYVKTGFNLGIPINTFLGLIPKVAANLGFRAPTSVVIPQQLTADDYFLQAGEKSDKGQLKAAIADYDQAIRLRPNYPEAYSRKGWARMSLSDYQGATADFEQAIRLNPNSAEAFYGRAVSRMGLKDIKGGLADLDQSIRLNPSNAEAYGLRASLRIMDKQKALSDIRKAIELYQAQGNDSGVASYQRLLKEVENMPQLPGMFPSGLNNNQGAAPNPDQAFLPKPDNAEAYFNRGLARSRSKDLRGALADFDEAIRLKPDYVMAYTFRSLVRMNLGDLQGQQADLQKVCQLSQAQGLNQPGCQ